jgi:putative pyruvate formate lyase activating enzyme
MTDLKGKVEQTIGLLDGCRICPRKCGVDRLSGQMGYCGIGRDAVVASYSPHHGEERPLSGIFGSGTIFFSGCNMHCQYCQNYDISQDKSGQEYDADGIAQIMISLERMKCHNINLVSPTHVMPQIVGSIAIAKERGLEIPIVYNTGGYDSLETLKVLDGIVDIYMPDMKYSTSEAGLRLSDAPDYPSINQEAVKEMHRQVGDLVLDEAGIAMRGLIVRHLVLPNDMAGSKGIFDFIAKEISRDTYVNVMNQYHPSYNSTCYPEVDRKPRHEEYEKAFTWAVKAGLHRFSN